MKIPGLIFTLLIICFTDIQPQSLQIFEPPSRNWSYNSNPGTWWESYSYSASVSPLNNGKIVFGIIDHSYNSIKDRRVQSVPYYFKLYGTSQPVVLYADSVFHESTYLVSTNAEFTNLFSPDQNDNLFIASSNFLVSTDNAEPAFITYDSCSINLLKESAGNISRLAHWDSTAHPGIVRDNSGRIHMMWEEIKFLNDHSNYSSKIYYTTITDGVIGEKILIGKGFYPGIKLGNDGKIHALWYEADTMSLSLTYKAKHCTIESGVFSSIDSIYDFHETSGYDIGHYYVNRFLPPLKWSVSKTGELQMVWIDKQSGTIAAGRFSREKGLEIVKSPSYGQFSSYSDAYKYINPFFRNDGEITIAWVANQKLYSASSRSNDIFNNISELSLPTDIYPTNVSRAFVPVIDTSGALVCFFFNGKNNFILKNFPGNSSFIRILQDYSISPGIFVDNKNNAWCVSSSDKPTVISFSLNDSYTQMPDKFILSQNYPNPFNLATKIIYSIPESRNVKITVYDMLGKEVATLVDGSIPAGNYTVQFEGSSLPSGIYIYTIQAGQFRDSKKLVLLK